MESSMAKVIFYEKPGCINNSKQKKLLLDAGHQVESRNLLTESWSRTSLLEYFDSMTVDTWFNRSAPDIKSGEVDPASLSEDEALNLMIENPLLIRRPLIQVGDECHVGFDSDEISQWIGLKSTASGGSNSNDDLETCPRNNGHSCKAPDSSVSGS